LNGGAVDENEDLVERKIKAYLMDEGDIKK
jgi:hypothetical protein